MEARFGTNDSSQDGCRGEQFDRMYNEVGDFGQLGQHVGNAQVELSIALDGRPKSSSSVQRGRRAFPERDAAQGTLLAPRDTQWADVRVSAERSRKMKGIKRTLASAAVTGALVVGAGADPALAAGYFNGPQATTSCPSGYGCVEGNVRTQGYNYGTTEYGWYAISFAYSESTPTIRVRNRNASTLRPVVIWRANSGWVNSGLNNATYMNVETGGYSCAGI